MKKQVRISASTIFAFSLLMTAVAVQTHLSSEIQYTPTLEKAEVCRDPAEDFEAPGAPTSEAATEHELAENNTRKLYGSSYCVVQDAPVVLGSNLAHSGPEKPST